MKKQIYIVDDDESVRRALKLLMVACGYATEAFRSAEEFFRAVPSSKSGCLILDLYLPGLSGWEAQRLIRVESDRPVIMISGDTNGDLQARALKAGAVGFLQKPFHEQELVELVNHTFSH